MKRFFACTFAVFFIIFNGCGETTEKGDNDENQIEDSEQTGNADADADMESGDAENLATNIEISDCGGFKEGSAVLKDVNLAEDEIIDCSQFLVWNYDESTSVIKILIINAELNCGGIHNVQIKKKETGYDYIMTEDLSKGDAGCSCLFDFSAELTGITADSLNLGVYLSVKFEKTDITLVWNGTLDLTQKSGEIIITERTGDGCSEFQQ